MSHSFSMPDTSEAFVRNGIAYLPWKYRGTPYVSEILCCCPACGVHAVIELPPLLMAEQPDDTTHACHPLAGGCNTGFYLPPLPSDPKSMS